MNLRYLWQGLKKNLKHILQAGIISHVRTQDSGFSFVESFIGYMFKYVICSCGHACWLFVFLPSYYSGMQRDSICLTSSATTSTCWRKTILASDMWIQTSSGWVSAHNTIQLHVPEEITDSKVKWDIMRKQHPVSLSWRESHESIDATVVMPVLLVWSWSPKAVSQA